MFMKVKHIFHLDIKNGPVNEWGFATLCKPLLMDTKIKPCLRCSFLTASNLRYILKEYKFISKPKIDFHVLLQIC